MKYLFAVFLTLVPLQAFASDHVTFAKDTFTLHAYAAYAHGIEGDKEYIPSATVGGSYYVLNSFALGAEVTGMYFDQENDDASGVAVSFLLRHHFYDTDKFTLYFEASSGPMYASDNTPEGGTEFNFLTRLAIGATIPIDDRFHVITGVRFFHLSNARMHGDDENPGIDAIQGYAGLLWRW